MSHRFPIPLFFLFAMASCTRPAVSQTLPDGDGPFLATSEFQKQLRRYETKTLNSLPELIEAGILLNPQLRSLAFRILAQKSLVDQGLLFEPPMFSFFSMGMASKWSVMVSQKIPWPSKLRQDLESRRAEVRVASSELAVVRNVFMKSIKIKYFELFEVARNLERMDLKKANLEKMLRILNASYPTSGGMGSDLVLMDSEILQTENEIVMLKSERTRILTDLNALLGRRSGGITYSGELPWKLRMDREAILRKALANAPEILKMKAELEVREVALKGVKLKYVPDFQVSAGWGGTADPAMGGATSPEASIMLGLSIRIPDWFSNLSSQTRALQYEQDSIRSGIDAAGLKLDSEIRNLLTKYDTLREVRCRVSGSVLPRTRKAIETMMISWSSGEDGLLKLLRMVDMEYELGAAVDNGLAQMAMILAMIEEMTGETISAAEPMGASCQK